MVSRFRALAGSDHTVVDLIIELAKQANSNQVSAIGAGLAQAVRACEPTRPDVAELIQQKIVTAGLQSLTTAFQVALGDVETAGVGGGGGGGAAGGGVGLGGATFGSAGAVANIGSSGSQTQSFSIGGVSVSGGGGSNVVVNNGSVGPVQ